MPRTATFVPILALVLAACGGNARELRPVPALAQTGESNIAFEPVRLAWENEPPPRTAATLQNVEAFLARYPNDGLVPRARVYRLLTLMDLGHWAPVGIELATLDADRRFRTMRSGTTRDLHTIARAKYLRHQGDIDGAFALLVPLVGKIIDQTDRELFLEELSLSAIAGHLESQAVAYLDSWLRGVSEDDKDRVRAKVRIELLQIPKPILESSYRSARSLGTTAGYSLEMQKLMAERLCGIAIQVKDAELARWLEDVTAGAVPECTGGPLGELATSRRGVRAIYGRTVGMLLSTTSGEARDRSADVAQGVSWALGLPRDGRSEDRVRLLSRGDGSTPERTEAALEELAGEGVALVIAGVDRASATRALEWCEAHRLPLVLLHPADKEPGRSTIVLGEDDGHSVEVLAGALATEKSNKAALLLRDEKQRDRYLGVLSPYVDLVSTAACSDMPERAGELRFPIALWKKEKVGSVLVAGPQTCARDVASELRASKMDRFRIGLTLYAANFVHSASKWASPGTELVFATAGALPATPERIEAFRDSELALYVMEMREAPSWWTALGHDAGTLAKAAVMPLPTDTASDLSVIEQRRAIAAAGLFAARTKLWTTEAPGFDAKHVIARKIGVDRAIVKGASKP